ncbi:hypothetical protein BGZ76_001067 [Entomortierella beljakovae]|nr:hypothetical protein BGZ76_001067 [Entomortierella beljakovae]
MTLASVLDSTVDNLTSGLGDGVLEGSREDDSTSTVASLLSSLEFLILPSISDDSDEDDNELRFEQANDAESILDKLCPDVTAIVVCEVSGLEGRRIRFVLGVMSVPVFGRGFNCRPSTVLIRLKSLDVVDEWVLRLVGRSVITLQNRDRERDTYDGSISKEVPLRSVCLDCLERDWGLLFSVGGVKY